jgi:signal transduction histidine kinase
LLRQLADSFTGRARVPVALQTEVDCALPVQVKVALYRIAQEALNNVAKHAGANQARIELRCVDGTANLDISDDGRGFDPDVIPPESLGLGIMSERAEHIQASLEIKSQKDQGTSVHVVWRQPRRQE